MTEAEEFKFIVIKVHVFNSLQVYKFCLLRELLLTCIKRLHMYQPS